MAKTLDEFADYVRNWSNRDEKVISDVIIKECLQYAADEATKSLEVPELQRTKYFYVTDTDSIPAHMTGYDLFKAHIKGDITTIEVPSDLSRFISVRSLGGTHIDSLNHLKLIEDSRASGILFNEKLDVRTFNDAYQDKYSYFNWTRKGNSILLSGRVESGDVIEIFYDTRALNLDGTGVAPMDTQYHTDQLQFLLDDNERLLLFGALYHVFDYLNENESSLKYLQKFTSAIKELNQEEINRKASGGNLQVHFNGNGLL